MAITAIIASALDCNNHKQKISVPPNPIDYKQLPGIGIISCKHVHQY